MSRTINDLHRRVSKFTAAALILGCVFLSSPGILLADDTTSPQNIPATDNVSQNQSDSNSAPLDVQAVQTDGSIVDQTNLSDATAPSDSLTATTSPATESASSSSPASSSDSGSTSSENPGSSQATTADASSVASTTSPSTASVAPSNSSDPSSANSSTGSGSSNNSATTSDSNTDITNNNYAQVFNDSSLTADTGTNSANYNTGSGIITTQKAEGDGELLNVINENVIQSGTGNGQTPDSASNASTGSGSDNSGVTNINNELTVKNVNVANAINRITANINSGNNDANFNTGHGIITTGDANLGLNFFSLANANLLGSNKFYANLQNIYNDYTGDIDLSSELASGSSPLSNVLLNAANSSTGQNSSNQAITNVNDQTTVTNQNTGSLNNEIDANVVSGKNKANYNTGTGSIVSGAVNSSVNVINFLNSNITSGNWMLKTLNVFGNWQGNLTLPSMPSANLTETASPAIPGVAGAGTGASNSSTGDASSNAASSSSNNSTSITNNNQATIENNVAVSTDAGNNDASYNGGSGIVKVGAANSETNQMNVANLNVTGDSWWLVVVNRFGDWNGSAVGSPEAVAIKTTGIATVLTPLQSGVDVTNSPTGQGSDNSSSGNLNNNTDVTNTNNAGIVNSLNINAISGENESQKNSGHGYVETGAIRGANNIINFANTNITVGNWVVVVVNVFGNWTGNLMFNTPGGGGILPVGGSLSCPVFNSNGGGSSTNSTTGSGSSNNSSLSSSNSNSATNNNSANLNNTTDASATTGQNSANYNTGSGSVSTGQAQAGSAVGNQANTNSVNAGQGSGSSSSSGNDATGSGASGNSSATSDSNSSVTNNNNATASNNISGSNNTGQNSSNYNTGNGSVDTSWASAFLSLRNQVNDNAMTMGDLTSDFNQQPVAPGSQALIPNDNSSTQTCPGVTVVVNPATASVPTGGTKTFTAVANDPLGNPVSPQPSFTWAATGGTIDASGVFTAGNTAGSFAVTATASYGNQGSATVTVTDPPAGGGGGGIITTSSGGGGGGGGGVSYYAPHIKGDFNNDGKVNDLDFSILMSMWGSNRTGVVAQDDGSGIAGDEDFSIVMSNWTQSVLAGQNLGLSI